MLTSRLIQGFSPMVRRHDAGDGEHAVGVRQRVEQTRSGAGRRRARTCNGGPPAAAAWSPSIPSERLSSSTTSRAPPASNCSPMCEPTWLAPPRTTNFPSEMARHLVPSMFSCGGVADRFAPDMPGRLAALFLECLVALSPEGRKQHQRKNDCPQDQERQADRPCDEYRRVSIGNLQSALEVLSR